MNRMQCENGHFYDGDVYEKCPHCKDGKQITVNTEKHMTEHTNNTSAPAVDKRDGNTQNTMSLFFQNIGKTVKKKQQENTTSHPRQKEINNEVEEEKVREINQHLNSVVHEDSLVVAEEKVQKKELDKQYNDLSQAISATESVDPDDVKTIGIYTNKGIEPVVGWLVCTKGPHFGMAYKLKDGKNQIGRSARMDVNVTDDAMISREHTVIMYESRERKFYLLMEGGGKVYVNEKILLMPQELQRYDRLAIGDSEFMFVPLCGENFDWSNESK